MQTITISKRHVSDFGMTGSYDTYKTEIHLREDGGIEHVDIHTFWDNSTRKTEDVARFSRTIGEREARRLLADVKSDALERFESWNEGRKQRVAVAVEL